jgi:tetratricopeptide (TPR) repeat protein
MTQKRIAPKSKRNATAEHSNSVPSLFAEAVRHHTAGGLFQAERGYRRILELDPDHAGSLHLLGVIGLQSGHLQAAEAMIRKAIALQGAMPDYHCNLGSVLQAMGKKQEALDCFQQALSLDPAHSKALNNAGNALLELGRPSEAIPYYERALQRTPGDADVHSNLGNAWRQTGRLPEAIGCYQKALAISPRHAQALFNLGCAMQDNGNLQDAVESYQKSLALRPENATACNNLGNALRQLQRMEEARASYQRALELQPHYAEAWHNLGNLLREEENHEAALQCFIKALAAKPDYLEAAIQCSDALRETGKLDEAVQLFAQVARVAPQNAEVRRNYGDALRKIGHLDEAEAQCRQAIALAAQDADAHLNLGNALFDAGKTEEAIPCYEKAIALRPAHALSNFNLAIAQLKNADFAAGWKGYEWRWELKSAQQHKRRFSEPLWRGEALHGQSILLYGEQGLGDCLQFLRYVPMVQAAGGKVILEIPQRLERLAAGMPGIDAVFTRGSALPQADWRCPLMSLPMLFNTDLTSIPSTLPYLSSPADSVLKARAYPWPQQGLRVGLSWSGNPKNPNNRFRSMAFSNLQKIIDIPDVYFYSLQLGEPLEQMKHSDSAVADLAPFTSDMADTAAFMNELDLVITVDTSIAHLAGALARPVWIFIPANADWRWLSEREDSPWYTTARLFRQNRLGDWRDVIERMATALQALRETRG